MAIKSNKKIDFEYEHECNGNTYSISLRLFESPEYGPCIGLLDENGDVATSLPVGMFPEVTDFLVAQGVIEGKKSGLPAPLPRPAARVPAANTARQPLPKPRLVQTNKQSSVNPLKPARADATVVDLENDTGETEEQSILRQIQEGVEGSDPAMSLHVSAQQPDALSEEEMNEIMAERAAAAKKVNTAGKKIQKKPKMNDEDE